MKKKIFLAVIAVLVLCLTCGMLLVACNDDKPNPDDDIDTPVVPPEEDLSAADALAEIVQNLDEVAKDNTDNKEFNFGIEIVDKGNGGNVIFGLATEKYDGKDYLYGAINGPYKKFNGFDLGATVQTILGWFGENIEIPIGKLLGTGDQTLILDAENVINLSSTLAGAVLTKNVKAQNGGYMVELDLAKVVGLVNTATSGSGGIDGLVEPYADIINTVIGAVKEAVLGADAATPTSLSEFLNAVAAKYQVLVYFGFDGAADADKETDTSDPFGGLMRGVLAARETTATNLLNFKGQIKIDAVNLTEKTPAEDGKAPTYDETVVNNYVLDIVVDLDPFVALGLLDLVESNKDLTKLEIKFKEFTVSDITAMLTEFGYMHISLDKMVEGKVDKNLFTLHYDSAENAAVAAAALVNQINGKDFAVGGVYNIDALGGLIDKLIKDAKPEEPAPGENASAETTAECAHEDKDNNCVCDTCGAAIAHVDANKDCVCDVCKAAVHVDANKDCVCDNCKKEYHPDTNNNGICDNQTCKKVIDFMALIGDVYKNLDSFYFINDTTKAITVNMTAIGEYLTSALLKYEDDAEIIMDLIPKVLGADALRISVAEGAFGFANVKASDHIAMEELVCNIRNDAYFGGNANVYMESITRISGDSLTAGSKVTVEGLAFDGTEVTLEGVIMDVVTTGEGENATTTYYVGIPTDLAVNQDTLKAIIDSIDTNIWTDGFEIPANWPFYGVLAYTPAAA